MTNFDWAGAVKRAEREGMTLSDIASVVGAASRQTISEIKHGKSRNPQGMVAVRLYLLNERILRRRRRRAERQAASA